MPSRIRIGPDGGPYVIVEENNGDLDITTPDDTIDLQNSGLINAALSGVLDAQNNDISNVGALTADSVSTGTQDITNSKDVDVASTLLGTGILLTQSSAPTDSVTAAVTFRNGLGETFGLRVNNGELEFFDSDGNTTIVS